jgi:hypothetical protein
MLFGPSREKSFDLYILIILGSYSHYNLEPTTGIVVTTVVVK